MPSKQMTETKLDDLCYKGKGLTKAEREYISKTLTTAKLFYFVNTRYPPDPVLYLSMTKKQLIDELKYPRY